jgi:phospholipase C
MPTRRDFLQTAALLTGGAFVKGSIPDAIARALAIDPPPNTTFRDAEHVVILMQENRSFDHSYGALRGVRGFRDPRAHVQPNGNRVWFQTDAKGDTYAPFRLDMEATNATWIGGLPHTWPDQVDARNGGRYDKWLVAKPKRDLPFTLGHYSRADIPFYYAFADAFTVCDQAFCSSLTGTTANRLYLWTAGIRRDAADVARVMNEDTHYEREAAWTTFPERLEDAGVSWRIYQNEVAIDNGLSGEEDGWLSNFGDNPLEWFTQYHIRFAPSRRRYLPRFIAETPGRISEKQRALEASGLTAEARTKLQKEIAGLEKSLAAARIEATRYTDAAWDALPAREKALHEKAFTTNADDPEYRSLTKLAYDDHGAHREINVPSGDILHRFRRDVSSGVLPAVSWLIAPQHFSDHPSSAWFGAWYVSEVLDILTRDPAVWKKTVFILCYDENDGYFDHVPPFVAPHPSRPETGRASPGIDTAAEWANVHGRESSIGLGYRVPLVIASPWSRGGAVNSQVFDHTSVIRFVETWLAANGTRVRETNISEWRRVVCGDLTSAFRPYDEEAIALPRPLDRDATVERIYNAKFRDRPNGGAPLSAAAIASARVGELQEPGTRPACPLPYELAVNGEVREGALELTLTARRDAFGEAAQGAAFNVYSYTEPNELAARAYAVRAGDVLTDAIPVGAEYRVRVDGPNGFMREFTGRQDAGAAIHVDHAGPASSGRLSVRLRNHGGADRDVEIRDESYGAPSRRSVLRAGAESSATIDTAATKGWYDFTVRVAGLAYRYAGRVETGAWSTSDPAMGG